MVVPSVNNHMGKSKKKQEQRNRVKDQENKIYEVEIELKLQLQDIQKSLQNLSARKIAHDRTIQASEMLSTVICSLDENTRTATGVGRMYVFRNKNDTINVINNEIINFKNIKKNLLAEENMLNKEKIKIENLIIERIKQQRK
eukprot:GHVR01140019.1.p1 GENE.GHVR01140019.1~~GHVR01140019.1.p1  ORF type:complete len:143 (+),score=43.36 GHVR01140019.1:35-463(+)